MATLAEIRARLQATENRAGNAGGAKGDNVIYPHWNIAEGTSAKVRFLPDADTKNTFFWIERAMIKLPFAGIKGQSDSKPVVVQVPCVEMWGDACPVLAEVRGWFKDPKLEEMGRKYWKKKSYLFQGFVHDNPMSDDKTPENPIRRFIISPQIFNLIKAALMDPDLENLPTDYQAGLDFTVTKTSKGGYSDYNTSKWARKETALTSDEAEAIEKFGLYNLADFLPKRPGEVEIKVIKEMFEASVDGEPYDPDRWAQYFKPPGLQGSNDNAAPAASAPAAKTSVDIGDDDIPFESAVAAAAIHAEPAEADAPVVAKPSSQRAEDILAMIRNRNK